MVTAVRLFGKVDLELPTTSTGRSLVGLLLKPGGWYFLGDTELGGTLTSTRLTRTETSSMQAGQVGVPDVESTCSCR